MNFTQDGLTDKVGGEINSICPNPHSFKAGNRFKNALAKAGQEHSEDVL